MAFEVEIGSVVGKWTVIEMAPKRKGGPYYLCMCECGAQHEVAVQNLRHGKSLSCMACARSAFKGIKKASPRYTLSVLDQLINKHLK